MAMLPASIRYRNPGEMWGDNRVARRWGALDTIKLNDGLNQGNTIAVFPDYISGAAAQFDLWRTGYCNMTLEAAIRKWSGGNSSGAYMLRLCERTGMQPTTVVTPTLLSSPVGRALLKAQAEWEAGQAYPMTEADWARAQKMVFSGRMVAAPGKKTGAAVAGAAVGTAAAAKAAHSSGFPPLAIATILVVGVAVVVAILVLRRK